MYILKSLVKWNDGTIAAQLVAGRPGDVFWAGCVQNMLVMAQVLAGENIFLEIRNILNRFLRKKELPPTKLLFVHSAADSGWCSVIELRRGKMTSRFGQLLKIKMEIYF